MSIYGPLRRMTQEELDRRKWAKENPQTKSEDSPLGGRSKAISPATVSGVQNKYTTPPTEKSNDGIDFNKPYKLFGASRPSYEAEQAMKDNVNHIPVHNDSTGTQLPWNSGVKFDEGKLRYDLVPWDAMDEIVKVLTLGAKKYEDRNWEKGMDWGRCIGATFRHVKEWAMGNSRDDETGLSHLAHAGCDILFLLAYEGRKIGKDDRPCFPPVSVV